MTLAIVLLAAGMGTRMNSNRQKILHEVGGRPMILHVVDAAREAADLPPVLVVGSLGGDRLRELVGDRAEYVVQEEQLGTGHATQVAVAAVGDRADQVLVTYGDMPLLRARTMAALAAEQAQTGAALAMLTVRGEPSSTFGRVVRGQDGRVREIVEVAQARHRPQRETILAISEHNVGVYCFDAGWLWANLPALPPRRARGGQTEFYLTDLVEMAVAQGRAVVAVGCEDPDEGLGAGTRAELVQVEKAFRRRANARWLAAGVTFIDPDATYIDQEVSIGRDTVIWPGTFLQGRTVIGEGCRIGPHVVIRNSQLGDGVQVEMAVLEGVVVEADTVVPPFAHWREP